MLYQDSQPILISLHAILWDSNGIRSDQVEGCVQRVPGVQVGGVSYDAAHSIDGVIAKGLCEPQVIAQWNSEAAIEKDGFDG